jgi:hypothetical protein
MENRQEAFAAGCDDFVEKDLEFTKIRDLMCRVLPNLISGDMPFGNS